MSGWISISKLLAKKRGKPTEFGGLIDISGSGARLYVTSKLPIGSILPLIIQNQKGVPQSVPLKIVWAKKDEMGNVETFDARIRLMQELIRNDVKVEGVAYGYLYGGSFQPEASVEGIRLIERYLNEQRTFGHETYSPMEVPDVSMNVRSFRGPDL